MATAEELEFHYSDSFRQRIIDLHRGKESWPNYKKYLADHLGGPTSRLVWFETQLIPEMEHRCGSLSEKRVLDFGCGTGSATVPLASHSRHVCAFDVDEESIGICRQRIEEHGLAEKVELRCAADLAEVSDAVERFDLVLLCGVLEHLPLSRKGLRRRTLRTLFSMLSEGGHLFVHDTPNRVWPIDFHSTQLWWIPWMRPGSRLAYKLAVARGRHSPAPSISNGPEGLEEVGAWGATYWEITRALSGLGFVCMNTVRGYDCHLGYCRERGWKRALAETVARWLAVRLLHVPITAFAPFLTNLVFMRSDSAASVRAA